MDAGGASGPQRGLEGGDGRGHVRVVLVAERLPVAGELAQRVIGAVHRHDEPGRGVELGVGEGEAALQFLSESDQGVVDADDALERVQLIQDLFAGGLSSRTVVELLPFVSTGVATPAMLDQLTTERDRIAELIQDLTRAKTKLDRVIEGVVAAGVVTD